MSIPGNPILSAIKLPTIVATTAQVVHAIWTTGLCLARARARARARPLCLLDTFYPSGYVNDNFFRDVTCNLILAWLALALATYKQMIQIRITLELYVRAI